jgi:predicted nucleotidyltransferase
MTRIVTVAERKDREAARRRAAADAVMSDLRAFGAARGGRFLVFGSAAKDRMDFDSDLDVVIDFPIDDEIEAIDFVESTCRKRDLPADVHIKSRSSDRFIEAIRKEAIQLP